MERTASPQPDRATPIFDEVALPAALRREHPTKPSVWGVVRVLDGQVKLSFVAPPEVPIVTSCGLDIASALRGFRTSLDVAESSETKLKDGKRGD